MMSRGSKDQSKELSEKHQAILSRLLKDDDNKYCVDCDAKGPRWAAWNLGVFLCIRCAGIHRNLGVHISKVKSINLDSWTPEQIAMMEDMGNSRARAVYEANLTDNYKRPAQSNSAMEQFIRAKYEHKKYIAKEWVPPKPRSQPSHYNDAITEPKKETKKVKTVLTVPGAAAGTTASASKAKEMKTTPEVKPQSNEEKTQPTLLGDFNTPTKSANPTTSADLLTYLFSSPPPAANSTASNDLFGLSTNHSQATVSPASQLPQSNGVTNTQNAAESQDLFQLESQAETQSKSTKDSILALYGNASQPTTGMMPNVNNMYNMQGSYTQPTPGAAPHMMYPANPSAGMMGGAYPANNPAMMGGGYHGAPQAYYQQPQMMSGPRATAPTGGMMGAYTSQQQQLYTQQLQAQMANMSLNQHQQFTQPTAVMSAGAAGAPYTTGNAAQSNGQTLNFDLWN